MSSYIFLLSIVSSPAAMLFRASSASSRTDDVYYVIFVMTRSEMEKDIVLSAQMTIDSIRDNTYTHEVGPSAHNMIP